MKTYIKTFTFLIIVSCTPNGIEEDIIKYESKKSSNHSHSLRNEKYYIEQAIEFGALNKDSIGDYPKAILFLDSAILVNPNSMTAYRLKSYAISLMGDYNGALSLINEAIIINQNDFENYMTRAGIFIWLDVKFHKVVD